MTPGNEQLARQLQLLRETIPSADRRRTPRGRMRTCAELADHHTRTLKLLDLAATETDRKAIESLAAEIDRQRQTLLDDGSLATQVTADREFRSKVGLSSKGFARLLDRMSSPGTSVILWRFCKKRLEMAPFMQ